MKQLRAWFLAIRPKTLGIAVVPVVLGSALAWSEGAAVNGPVALAALVASLLIQIGTNLYNDAADHERGADTPDRLGPPRATAQGWFSAAEVKLAAWISFGLAFLLGIFLSWVGGWPIVVIGLLSLTAGWAYTGGPRPIAYTAFGELFVFIFFGLVGVLGSYYLQRGDWSGDAVLVAAAVGMLAAAVLLVNNYRDLDTDERARKLTLAHYLGPAGSSLFYGGLLLLPFTLPLWMRDSGHAVWLVVAALPMALYLWRRFSREPRGPAFNRILARTAQLQLLFGALLTAALCIDIPPS
ncbi:MAG TPA: 1,4-dihydroxy-2-naphthoate polyprenyltransferase [Sedimenticola thiotaurini]|uniref:1,4-dihydroxy-2-naphthoate octaprenyltransferase n=1 Tax=Sedimenticola thiotaurini TaxID=1543721 RepID=A0A831RNQ1_9GAMM|nr:1,4-dihydroxy-2-naphthoate polyprenyltransferase [Sedimenticola thiotaurini]